MNLTLPALPVPRVSLRPRSLRTFSRWAIIAVALVAGLVVNAPAQTAGDSKAATKTLMQKFIECWETGDRATFESLLHPNLVFGYPGGRFDRAGLLKTFDDYQKAKKDIRVYFGEFFISNGQKHVLSYQFAATDRVSGKRFAVGTGVMCELADGKIILFKEYWDTRVPEQQKAGELPLDEGKAYPWPASVWLRAETIN